MNKRKLKGINNGEEPPRKRAKTWHRKIDPWNRNKTKKIHAWHKSNLSKKNSNTDDEEQYDMIFTAIEESKLIQQMEVPDVVIQEISDGAAGNLLKCWTNGCNEYLSFLNKEKWDGLDK